MPSSVSASVSVRVEGGGLRLDTGSCVCVCASPFHVTDNAYTSKTNTLYGYPATIVSLISAPICTFLRLAAFCRCLCRCTLGLLLLASSKGGGEAWRFHSQIDRTRRGEGVDTYSAPNTETERRGRRALQFFYLACSQPHRVAELPCSINCETDG